MDKALTYGAGDRRLEFCRGHICVKPFTEDRHILYLSAPALYPTAPLCSAERPEHSALPRIAARPTLSPRAALSAPLRSAAN